jgi:hypothetical protein
MAEQDAFSVGHDHATARLALRHGRVPTAETPP